MTSPTGSYGQTVKHYGEQAIDAWGTKTAEYAYNYGVDKSEERSQTGMASVAKEQGNKYIKENAEKIQETSKQVFNDAVDSTESSYNKSSSWICTIL